MRTALIPFAACSVLFTGCISSSTTYSYGRDFDSSKVGEILKGQTEARDLVRLFGEPLSKSTLSANEEKWIYMHTSGVARVEGSIYAPQTTTTGRNRTLDILLEDGIVINYTYSDTPDAPKFTVGQ